MASLAETVKNEVFSYAGGGHNIRVFALSNEEKQVYAVTVVDTPHGDEPAGIVVMARVDGDRVIIEEDTTDKPIYEVLMFRGIPREKIILAYAGEAIPDPQPGE